MLETKTLTSPTSSPSIRSVASTTLPCTALATAASVASESTVRNTSRWMDRSASTITRTPRWAVCRRTQSPKWRAECSSIPETPSISQAASAAMLAMTSLATLTAPRLPLLPMQPMLRPRALSPFHVRLGPGVDADHIPALDEEWHLDDRSGLERGRLGTAGHRVAPKARVGLDDSKLDVDRELDPDELALVPQQVGDAALLEQGQHRLQHLFIDRHLVVGARVHGGVVGAIRIQVRGIVLVDADGWVLVAAAEAVLEDRAGQQVAELGLDDGARPSELDVLDADDLQQLAVHIEHRAVAKIAGRDHWAERWQRAPRDLEIQVAAAVGGGGPRRSALVNARRRRDGAPNDRMRPHGLQRSGAPSVTALPKPSTPSRAGSP